jgi:hypothetical protein
MPGTIAVDVEVTNSSGHCLWVLVDDEELALPFSEFPWFRSATIDQVLNVVRPSGPHLYWPDLGRALGSSPEILKRATGAAALE